MSRSVFGAPRYPRRASSIQPTVVEGAEMYGPNPSRLLQNNLGSRNDPLRNPQIQNMVAQSTDQDILFYEYEIVDKKKENAFVNEKMRSKGLCMCQRWVCMLIGNLIIIAIICGLIGLLVYLNTSTDTTKQPKTYLETCTTGSSDCNTIADLKCPNGTCLCNSNKSWNGTDCVCPTDWYWDGYNCITNKLFGEACSTASPCMSYLQCDNVTNTCVCSSTTYYTNSSCQNKKDNGKACSTFTECQTYLGLTCTSNTCQCYSKFYWNNSTCTAQLLNGGNCQPFPSTACDSTLGLSCQSNLCACLTTHYWHTTNLICTIKGVYGTTCSLTSDCDTTKSFICSTSTACTCPTTYAAGRCDCTPSTHFYDGSQCIARKTANQACPGTYACSGSLTCTFGLCV